MLPFPFFVGRGRSGTTLVRAMFDSHPEMAVPNESHFIVALSRRRRRYERSGGFLVEPFLADLETSGFVDWHLDPEIVRQALTESAPANYVDAVRRLFAAYATTQGKSRYADKTPVHVLNLRPLSRLFPEARFIHIIRDGRDVALSYLQVPWGPQTLEEATILWKRAVARGQRAGAMLGPDRYHEVRYEALVADPETAVRSMCSFVHLDYVPEMLRYFERADAVVAPLRHPGTRQGLYLPPTQGLRDWRSQMAHPDVVRFEILAGDLIEDLGYERAAPKAPIAEHLAARGHWLRVQVARVSRRVRKMLRSLGVGRVRPARPPAR